MVNNQRDEPISGQFHQSSGVAGGFLGEASRLPAGQTWGEMAPEIALSKAAICSPVQVVPRGRGEHRRISLTLRSWRWFRVTGLMATPGLTCVAPDCLL